MTGRPNILLVMADQLSGRFFPDGPADWLHMPHLKRLAARSARFTNAYCTVPLCAPARAGFMTGQLPSAIGVYDNAAEFRADIPTFAHHLRAAGYRTILCGKMHFVGPDQLHGFEERLTTDIYPADYGWTPDYRRPGERIDWWYHNLGSVSGAGVAEVTNQLEFDDEVAFCATARLRDLARGADPRPWMMTVSFTHPHDPYVARRRHWDLYADCPHLAPEAPDPADDPHSARLRAACAAGETDLTEEMVRRARRAHFANISYLDDKLGEILEVLEATRQEAAVLFTADHGDMLGERGLWFKMTFHEGSARVPLLLAAPGVAPGPVATPVSHLDVLPTLCALAGVPDAGAPWATGQSLLAVAAGAGRGAVPMEYAAEGSIAPLVALREGRWKLVVSAPDPDQLFDLDADPHERVNLAADPAHGAVLAGLRAKVAAQWDLDWFDAAVRDSQARRWIVYAALREGAYRPWDWQPGTDAANRFMRNHMDLNLLETAKRFPRGE
jgi:choline-sulfatase